VSETPSPKFAGVSLEKLAPYAMQSRQWIASRYASLSANAKRWLPFAVGAAITLACGLLWLFVSLCVAAAYGYWCRDREIADAATDAVTHDA